MGGVFKVSLGNLLGRFTLRNKVYLAILLARI
jgi:hypothetical protein